MKQLLIKLVAFMLSAMMILTMMPGTLMAEEGDGDLAPQAVIVTLNDVGYSDLTSAFAAAQGQENKLILQTDIILANPVTISIPWGATATLDLNGHKIRMYDVAENIAPDNSGSEYTGEGGMFVLRGGKLEIVDNGWYEEGSITSSNQSQSVFRVIWDDSIGTYLNIKSGIFTSSAYQDLIQLRDVYGYPAELQSEEIQISGGSFDKQQPAEYIAAGYTQEQNYDGTWNVVDAPVISTYTVYWQNYDGTILDSATVSEGGAAYYGGEMPTRPDDESYTYSFSGWDVDTSYIMGDTFVTAQYSPAPIIRTYTVVWQNYDGTTLDYTTVNEGGAAYYGGEMPTRPDDESYTYSFSGWDVDTSYITGDTYVTAQYSPAPIIRTYTVVWQNYDGTTLDYTTVNEGGAAYYGGEMPTRPDDESYTYSFSGWDVDTSYITGDTYVTAQYSSAPIIRTYTVVWQNYDGTTLDSATVNEGGAAYYGGEMPTRPDDESYTYSFSGWDVDTSYIAGDTYVTAQYSSAPIIRTYTVVWQNYDGTTLDSATVNEGGAAYYGGEMPTRPDDESYTYSFSGWDVDTSYITGDTTVTAQYDWTPIPPTEYSVTFTVLEDPSVAPPTEYVEEGNNAYDPGPVEVNGYVFEGWYAEGTSEVFDFSEEKIYGDVNLVAALNAVPTYKLYFDLGRTDVTNAEYFTEIEQEPGEVLLPEVNPATENDAAYFAGWYADEDRTMPVQIPITLVDSDKTIYAGWEYEVTFYIQNDQAYDPEGQNVLDGRIPEEPTVDTVEGWTFQGWYLEPQCETQYNFDTGIKEHTNLYGKWEQDPVPPTTYTVTFELQNHGTLPADQQTQTVEEGKAPVRPYPDPQEEGWSFGGWYQESECSNLYDFDAGITGETKIYAKWTENPIPVTYYTVTFNASGHGTAPADQKVESGKTATKPADLTEMGWTFGGWLTADNTAFDFSTPITGDITLYAKWTENPPMTYTVTFSYNGRGTDPYATVTVNEGQTVAKPEDPSATGYIFGGWYNDTTCTQQFDFNTPIKEYKILYAKWTEAPTVIEKYSVTFYTAYGVTPDGQLVEKNKKAIKPADPVASGYVFEGWYTDSEYTTPYDFNTPVTQNLTIYAKWSEEPTTIQYFTVNFYTELGTAPTPQTVEKGYAAVKPTDPTAEGYVFSGWYTDKELKSLYNFNTAVMSNTTLFAKWTALPVQNYVVSFNSNGHGNTPNPQTVQTGQLVQKPADPTATGYTFTGWYLDSTCTQAYNFRSPVNSNLTLFAGWTANRYTIRFDSNSGVGTMASISCVYDTKAILTPNAFTKSGYYFIGWNTTADGSGVLIADKAEVRNLTDVNGGTVNLYAQWKNIYSVIEGANAKIQKGGKEGITFRTDGDYSKFTGIRIDNNNVATSQYTSWAGSTYVQLHADYVNQMPSGVHTIRFLYTDGAVETMFEVVSGTPKTGDTNNALIWIIIAIVALIIIIVIIIILLARRRGGGNDNNYIPDRERYADPYDDEFEEEEDYDDDPDQR